MKKEQKKFTKKNNTAVNVSCTVYTAGSFRTVMQITVHLCEEKPITENHYCEPFILKSRFKTINYLRNLKTLK